MSQKRIFGYEWRLQGADFAKQLSQCTLGQSRIRGDFGPRILMEPQNDYHKKTCAMAQSVFRFGKCLSNWTCVAQKGSTPADFPKKNNQRLTENGYARQKISMDEPRRKPI